MELDEFDRGYPRLTLGILIDVVGAVVAKDGGRAIEPREELLKADDAKALKAQISQLKIDSSVSWRALLGKLARLHRLRVFDNTSADPLRYQRMLVPGSVSIVDLSDSNASEMTNLVIADLLRGVQEMQDRAFRRFEASKNTGNLAKPPSRVMVIIEEAHEFLSDERIDKMPILFQQLARIAKRGRKRWLGLVFVTQFPQHLPRQVLGLVNSFVIHKITYPYVASQLRRTISGIDEGMWRRLPGLAPGQAIVSFPHMARPLLVSIDPTPAKLRLVD